MSYTSLFSKASISALALALGGCASLGGRTTGMPQQKIADVPQMSQAAVVRDPCNSVGIEAVPARQVADLEIQQNLRAGRRVQNHNGYVIFSDEPLAAKFGPLAGGLLGAVAGSAIGGGSARIIFGGAGATGGSLIGEFIGKNSRVEYLTDLAACREYLNKIGPAPQPHTLDMNGPDVPVNRGTPRIRYLNDHVFTR